MDKLLFNLQSLLFFLECLQIRSEVFEKNILYMIIARLLKYQRSLKPHDKWFGRQENELLIFNFIQRLPTAVKLFLVLWMNKLPCS